MAAPTWGRLDWFNQTQEQKIVPPFVVPALCVVGLSVALLLTLKVLANDAIPAIRNITSAILAFSVQCIGLWLGVLAEDHVTAFLTPWLSKIISLCGVILFIRFVCGSLTWAELGICLPNPRGIGVTACFLVCFLSVSWIMTYNGSHRQMFSPNSFFYMLMISGLDEELVFRGLMPSLLLVRKNTSCRLSQINRIVAFAVPASMFSLMHAWRFSGGHFSFSAPVLGIVGAGACALMYLRVHTGSLLNSVVLHNAINAGTVIALAMA